MVKLNALWHRVGLLYVDRLQIIVGQVLGLVVDRWEGVRPPAPLADPPPGGPHQVLVPGPHWRGIYLHIVDLLCARGQGI